MSLISRAKAAAGTFFGGSFANNTFSLINRATSSGVAVTAESSQHLSPYYAAIRNISEDIGKMPTWVFENRPENIGGKQRLINNSVDELFTIAPNDDMTPITFKETVQSHALGWGNGFAEIVRNRRGEPVQMIPIHPGRVTLKRDGQKLVYEVYPSFSISGIIINQFGESKIIQQKDMFHIKGLGLDGLSGYNLTNLAAESIGSGLAAQTFAGSFFGNGAWAGGILSHPNKLKGPARDNLLKSWNDRSRGANKGNKTVVLEEGMKFEQLTIDPRRAQFVEVRKFTVVDIARWFRIPPHKIADLDRATFSNITDQNIDYLTDTLLSWIIKWEQEISRKLLKRRSTFARFQTQELLRGDPKALAETNRVYFNMGTKSVNEIRADIDLNPIGPEGNLHYVQLNMGVLGDTENEGSGDKKGPVEESSKNKDDLEDDNGDIDDNDEGNSDASILAKINPILNAAIIRVNNKERKATERAKKKGPDAWLVFSEKFYPEQMAYCQKEVFEVVKTVQLIRNKPFISGYEELSEAIQAYYTNQLLTKSKNIENSSLRNLFANIIRSKEETNANTN